MSGPPEVMGPTWKSC